MWDRIWKFLTDNKDVLDLLLGSGIILAVLGGIVTFTRWLIKEYRLRRIRTNDDFPFKIIPPNSNVAKEILGGADDDPLADRNIPYQQRIQGRNIRRELEELIEDNRWILIAGRTGLGKTREAVQLAQSLSNEGWTILYLTREAWLDAPAKLPNNVPERKLLFFLDDLNKKCLSSKAEIRPDARESLTLPIYEPFQTRLQRTLEAFDTFCGKNEIRVIATVRNEKTSELDEPSEWDKLGWGKYNSLWEKFNLSDLPEPDKTAEQKFLAETAGKADIVIKSGELSVLAKRNDGTFRNLVENLASTKTEGLVLSSENFRDTLKGTWQKRFQRTIQKYPEAKHIYDAIELLQGIDLKLKVSVVLQVANIIANKNFLERVRSRWRDYSILKQLIKIENLLEPRDGQIEAKGYRVISERFLPSIYKQTYWNLARSQSSFSFGFQRIIGLLTLSLTPKSIFISSSKLGKLEKMYCSLLDLDDAIEEIAEHYAKVGFELYAESLFLKLVDIADSGLLSRIVNRKFNSYTWRRLGNFYNGLDRFEDAIIAYQRAIDLDPKLAYPWNGLGSVYRQQDKYEEAIIAFQKAIDLDPKLAYPWNGLGNVYRQQDKYEDAIIAYQKAIDLDSKFADPCNGLGNVYRQQDKYEDAIIAYQKAIDLDPKFAYPWNGLGNVYGLQDKYEEAIIAFQKAIDLDPKWAYPWNGLGNVYRQQDKYEEAIIAFQKAIDLDPKWAYPWNGLGNVYRQQDKYEDAIIAYQKAIDLDPKLAYPWNGLGIVYGYQKKYAEAITVFQKAIELDPKDAVHWDILGYVHGILGRFDDAIQAFRTAIELNPRFAEPWQSLGHAYNDTHHYDDAIQAYQKAIELKPKDAASWNGLGNVYRNLKQYHEAIRAYNKAIEFDPNDVVPWISLGRVYRKLNQYDEAVQACNKAIELDPKDASAWHDLGIIFSLQNDFEGALTAYQKAAEIEPKSGTVHSSLVGALRKLGKEKEAQQGLENTRLLMENETEYNRACFESICGNTEEALELLKIALEQKQTDIEWMRQDPDFDLIRDDPRFKKIIGLE